MRIQETNQILRESEVGRVDVTKPEPGSRFSRMKSMLRIQSKKTVGLIRRNAVPMGLSVLAGAVATGAGLIMYNNRPRRFSMFRF